MSFVNPPILSIFLKSKRSISTISGYITIQEQTLDELEITQHPVQIGASITDHAYLRPTLLSMQIQFNPNSILTALGSTLGGVLGNTLAGPIVGAAAGAVAGVIGGAFNNDTLSQTYKQLLDLQQSRVPFDVSTPKRSYLNMLMQTLTLLTDKNTENVLSIYATFQQVVLVDVSPTTFVNRIAQKNPGNTGQTEQAGHKSSLLLKSEGIQSIFSGLPK